MSGNNCWRGSVSTGEPKSDDSWPKLNYTRRCTFRKRKNEVNVADRRDNETARSVDRASLLEDEEFPRLGQRLIKRKLTLGNNNVARGPTELPDINQLTLDEHKACQKSSKKPRRSDLIRIDLEKVLERQRSLSESNCQSSSTPKKARIKVNVSLAIRNPLDSAKIVNCRRGKRSEVPRAKRVSKLKRIIIRERECQRQLNLRKRAIFDLEKLEAMTKDVNAIDFEKLKISCDSNPEMNYVRNMSTITLFDNEYRKPSSENFVDENPEPELHLTKRLEALLLDRENAREQETKDEIEPIDSAILQKTLCLKICDETGETVEDFEDPETASRTIGGKLAVGISNPARGKFESTEKLKMEFSNLVPKSQPNVGSELEVDSSRLTDNPAAISPNFHENPDIASSSRRDLLETTSKRDDVTPKIVNSKPETTVKHSKHFREYCTNVLTPGLNVATELFLSNIVRLQRRLYEVDEVKGRSKRRFYAGFKEVAKHVETKRIKFVLIAPDLEGIPEAGGIFEMVKSLLAACKAREIVVCFALNKRKLGYHTHKKGSVSCVGVANYSGLEENLYDVLSELVLARISHGIAAAPQDSQTVLVHPSKLISDDMLLTEKINVLLKNLTSY